MRGSFEHPDDADIRRGKAEAGDIAAGQEPLRLSWPEAVCDRVRPLLETFHDGALRDADERFVRDHVASCARCTARLRHFDELDAVLRLAPTPRAGPELRTQLYARIAATQQRRSAFDAWGSWRKRMGKQHARARRGSGPVPSARRGVFGIGRPGLVTSWINGVAAIAVVALLALLFNTLTGMPNRASVPESPVITGQALAPLAGLPAFSDYRAAYLDTQGQLRIVSVNGKSTPSNTQPGPTLPKVGLLTRMPAAPYYDVAVSQDGHYLAYVEGDASISDAATPLPNGGPVAVVNLKTGTILSMPVMTNDLTWSPDSRFLAAPDVTDSAGINILDAAAGVAHRLAISFAGTQASVSLVAGWIDTIHVAVFYQHSASAPTPMSTATEQAPSAAQSGASTQQYLGSMDTRSGAISYLADLPDPSDVFLSPDGTQILLAPNYSTKMAYVIDTRTGRTRPLPTIANAFAEQFVDLGYGNDSWSLHSAWHPGTGHVLALSLSIGSSTTSTQKTGVWLLDLDNDNATLVHDNAYPLAWFPQPPQALVTCEPPPPDSLGSYPTDGAGVGSKLYMFAPVEQGGIAFSPAGSMVAFLGLVRTA